jgi:protein-tyrosine phosphatase
LGDVTPNDLRSRAAESGLKRIYLTARNLPDRVLHQRRRASARERILKLDSVSNILVVCYGNICRSPYLEAVLRRGLPEIGVTSAGFVGPGRSVPAHALKLANMRGLDLSSFRSRPIGRANVDRTDLVIVMDTEQARHIARGYRISPSRIVLAGDLDPVASPTRAIRDPWGESIEVFATTFDRLDRCAETLVRILRYRR